nr:hybrid sensor histidine kinase/response regulator [Dyella sp. ASV24]
MKQNSDQIPGSVQPTSLAGGDGIGALRRHQRQLLYGGGGLISLLMIFAGLASVFAGIQDFHAREQQVFEEGRVSIDEFLTQRDRAYANSLYANNALWTQKALLLGWGNPLLGEFRDHGESMTIAAPGDATPWLVVGDDASVRLGEQLPAYLGMIEQYSAYTKATVAAVQSGGPLIAYGYEPSGALLAVTGVSDEAAMFKALGVATRANAITRLMISEQRLQSAARVAVAGDVSVPVDQMAYYFDRNPFNGEASLVTVLSLTVNGKLYFRRVTFEPMSVFRSRLEQETSEAFAIVSRDGEVLVRTGDVPQSLVVNKAAWSAVTAGGRSPTRVHLGSSYLVASALQGVDWIVVHPYTLQDVLRARGSSMAITAIVVLIILAVLWLVLLRMDRRVFAPALADASRVYESDALNRTIVQTSPVGLALIDPRTRTPIMQNNVVQAVTGEDPEVLRALYDALMARAAELDAGALHEFLWSYDQCGAPKHLQVVMAPAMREEKPAWLCVLRDVTAETELQERLQQARRDSELAREAAESASQAKSAFVATMSHEIRTPLNAVLGHLELLSRSPLAPAQKERIERIRFSADSLLDIISDVLDFSRIESGQLAVEMGPFALRPLIEQAALLYAPEAQRKGVKLFYSIDPELAASYVSDAHRLRQILNNLLGNAVKFTESGRILLRVLPVMGNEGARLRFEVVDSGIGMGPEQLSKLFVPFTQADASISRRYGGSGLGLALCRQLSQLLGGDISAQSTPGVGSVFVLELPARVVPAGAPMMPLKGWGVDLLSAASEWRQEVGQMLTARGADVISVDAPAQLPSDGGQRVLLIVGERRAWSESEESDVLHRYGRRVFATPSGPLVPEEQAGRVLVTCYLSDAMVAAVLGSRATTVEVSGKVPVAQPPRRARVLLVEDHPVNRELIQQQLEAIGFEADVAEDGRSALHTWNPAVHAAVLTDINMPGMNGYELARALREHDTAVPILAITATAVPDEVRRCEEAGITALLLKPLSLERLDAALTEYLPAAPTATIPEVDKLAAIPEKVRRLFVRTGLDDLGRLARAREAGDVATLRSVIHAFKGVLLMLKEREAATLCAALEDELASTEIGALEDDLARVTQVLEDAVERYRRSFEP